MSSGHTLSFHLTDGVRTLVFEKGDRETREPESVIVVNRSGSGTVDMSLEWVRHGEYLGDSFFICDSRPIEAADSRMADLRGFFFRSADQMYVTVSGGAADLFIHLEEQTGSSL